MIQPISRTEALKKKLKEEGKVTYLDKPEDMAAIVAMNDQLEDVRRDYQRKDNNSQFSASKVILTA